jgi:maltose alpha-D-glucosyltransferase/alpha-amylase
MTSLQPDELRDLIEQIPPEVWHGQRWFAGKGRDLAGRKVRDLVLLPDHETLLALALIDVSFGEGAGETYFIPLALRPGGTQAAGPTDAGETAVLLSAELAGSKWELLDGLAEPALGPALLRLLGDKAQLDAEHGRFHFQPTRAFDAILGGKTDLPAKVLPPLQSNSLVNYGDRALLKCMRRVRPGINADLEITYFLTTKTDFANIPRVAGLIEYVDEGHSHWPLAILQSYIHSQGDAWKLVQQDLRDLYREAGVGPANQLSPAARDLVQRHSETAYRLGERTGQLHAALASDDSTPDFAPELVTTGDWAKWSGALLQELKESFELLRTRLDQLPADVQTGCRRLLDSEPRLTEMAESLKENTPQGLYKIRYHGDYHLGQVLVTRDDFVIIDFEGEPMRPVEQRRSKQLALKDVAGMLRSFNYAGYAALFEGPPPAGKERKERVDAQRTRWEQTVRVAFLQGYGQEVNKARVPLAPTDTEVLMQLLALFELEKALYELRYELSNRPDWVRIPVNGISQIVGQSEPGKSEGQ